MGGAELGPATASTSAEGDPIAPAPRTLHLRLSPPLPRALPAAAGPTDEGGLGVVVFRRQPHGLLVWRRSHAFRICSFIFSFSSGRWGLDQQASAKLDLLYKNL
jgi:hypothetical protein